MDNSSGFSYCHISRALLNIMKYLTLALCLFLLNSCQSAYSSATKQSQVGITRRTSHWKLARITYYTDHKTAIGVKPVQGATAAAHPSYPFHTLIKIPELQKWLGDESYEVQDRGSAVTSRAASHGKTDVFDIYVKNAKTMRYLEKFAPEYMQVIQL